MYYTHARSSTQTHAADLDEIECLLSNMIFDKKLKGYISHKQRMLVVDKTDPFPTDKIVIRSKK